MRTAIALLVCLSSFAGCSSGSGGNTMAGMPVQYRTLGMIERFDKRLDALLAPDARMEILDYGYDWVEGPVWVKDGGYLLFSEIPPNKVFKWKEGEGSSLYLHPSGYTGSKPRGVEPGSNGLLVDPKGNLILCQHGDRRLARMDAPLSSPKPRFVTLADKADGKRLNSPNDVARHSSGALFFTDPPYGLVKWMNDEEKEIPYQGVYRLDGDGKVTLLAKEIDRPNGIAFSPDEKTLYVASSHPPKAVWMAYDVKPDLTLANGRVFFDATKWVDLFGYKGLPDGLKVDVKGNLWASGPGGILVIAPDGAHLGNLRTFEATSNCAWGNDGGTLYITADMYLLRIRTLTKGAGF